jgi:outer membrane protein TolC
LQPFASFLCCRSAAEGAFDESSEMNHPPRIMHRFLGFVLLLVCLAVGRHPTFAAAETRTLSLQDCFRLALEHNLDVQIERFGPEISGFNYEASRGAYDPALNMSVNRSYTKSPGGTDPRGFVTSTETDTDRYSFGLGGLLPWGMTYNVGPNMARSGGTRFLGGSEYSSSVAVTVRQPLLRNLWIDNARQQLLITRKNQEISAYDLENQIISILTRVEQVYYDLIFARENVKVQEKALELAEKLLEENRKRVQVGAMAPLDEKQAESQVAARRADLLDAQRTLSTQQNNLRNLLTDDYGAWHQVRIDPADPLLAVPEDFDLQESWQRGLAQRPDLLRARADLERRDIQLRFQRNQIYPSLDLEATYGQSGLESSFGDVVGRTLEGSAPRHTIGLVFSIPLYNRDAKNRYQATRAEKMQAILRLKKQEQDIVVQIDESVNLARTQFQRIEATRQARLYAEAALEAEEKKLASGKSTSFIVLQLQRDLTTARSNEIRALADYRKALAALAQARGATLERSQLKVEIK